MARDATIYRGLKQLGEKSRLPDSPEQAVLERVPNPHPRRRYLVRFAAPDGTQELSHFDGLEVIEAELMPARHAEAAIGRVLRACFNAGEARVLRVAASFIIEKFIQAFLREHKAALFTREFKAKLHLAARLNPIGLDGAATAASEIHKNARHVIH